MSGKYILHYSREGIERELRIEDFTDAILCEGHVFFRERVEHSISTDPGQCWGEYIDYPPGSFLDGEFMDRAGSFCIDWPGTEHTVTEIVSLEPLCIRTVRHVGIEYPAYGEAQQPYVSRSIALPDATEVYSPASGESFLAVNSFSGAEHTLLVPAVFRGKALYRLDLRGCDLSALETLIVSEGVRELALDLSAAQKLTRLQLPSGIRLLCPLDGISRTPWFRALPPEPVYIADCYCGTPGGGSGGSSRCLVIPEGIVSVAAAADFHCYWHSIKTPASLRSIGPLAFASCHCLEELNLSEGLERLSDDALHSLFRLKSLHLPRSLRFIGEGCFSRCLNLDTVSLFSENQAELFTAHSISILGREGREEKHLSKSPPFLIELGDRIAAFPPRSPFTAAGRCYRSTDELALHPLADFGFEYLDIHGRRTWHIAARDDCRRDGAGERLLVERWFIRENDCVTQIEETVDGTRLVREGIGIIDVDFALRNIAAREVFGLCGR